MRKNGLYSKEESFFATELTKLGISYIPQYQSEQYPFLCDFYLPDYDIYIELNLYWSHNKHYFDKTNAEDLET